MLLGLKTCAGFLNCLRGTSEASALLFFFLAFIWGCLHYSPQQNVSISMSSILSTILSLWWLWTRTACTTRALATVYRHITHTHTYTESLFKWRFWVVCACATLAHWRQVATVLQHQLAMGCRGSAWPGLAWGLQIDLNAKNNNELSMWERLSGLHSLSLYRSVSLSLSINNAVKRL